jgi:rSAM/selenodomain-associated transferase 2
MRLSVIIPALDEAARIGRRLEELAALPGIDEVVVVDGGSTDETARIAASHAGVRVVHSARGRALQMNAGAAVATGSVLLFLHADTQLPLDAALQVATALGDSRVVAGAFRTWTVDDTGTVFWAPLLHLADLRSRYSGLPYGDQALFVRQSAFAAVGGFPRQPLMEDLELSLRLRRLGTIRVVPSRVRVSGRRFIARPLTYTFLVNVFPALYRLGVSAEQLARLYGHVR